VVGHQVGGGNGKKAMTVLGAVGGGLAGHEIEKHARATTVYHVQLRMDDGSKRTVTQTTSPAVGARFDVQGQELKPLAAKG
jgi:outer membrane lipoprotein SlyB